MAIPMPPVITPTYRPRRPKTRCTHPNWEWARDGDDRRFVKQCKDCGEVFG